MWDAAYMGEDVVTPLQAAIRSAVQAAPRSRDYYDGLVRERTGTKGKPIYDIDRGKSKRPSPDTLRVIEEVMGMRPNSLQDLVYPRAATSSDELDDAGDNVIEMVGIQHIDMAYGLGTTFAVDYPDIEVMKFPKVWIESITHSPPATLTWTRGKGDSMEPTIRDGDLVLLDRSQRALTERDAMWAFTIGEEAAIKRLRRQGEMCEIFSDNPNVPPDKQPLRDLNIVGRVVFVGSRK